MVDLSHDLYLILLEEGHISYEEYCKVVPKDSIPKEYKTLTLFHKNCGKASKRIQKESEWKRNGLLQDAMTNWKNISE